MTPNPLTVEVDTPVTEAQAMMQENRTIRPGANAAGPGKAFWMKE